MIIFDLDGTLWNTVNATFEAAKYIENKYNDIKEITMEIVVNGMGLSAKENAKNYLPYLDEEKAMSYLKEMDAKTAEIINIKGATLYDNVSEVIYNLSKKYKLAIVTNNRDEYAKTFLKVTNLEKYFTDYMGAATYKITKSDTIKKVVKRNKESNSVYVGDIKKDMIATNEAGITFIHAKYGFEPTLQSKYQINNLLELENIVNDILK